jgi:hypothetical protein
MFKAKFDLDLSKLKTLKDNVQKKILKKAVRAGIKPLLTDLRSKVPMSTGSLKKSLASKVDSVKGETTTYGVVGPRSKWKKVVKGRMFWPARYAAPLNARKRFLQSTWSGGVKTYLQQVEQVIAQEIKSVLG